MTLPSRLPAVQRSPAVERSPAAQIEPLRHATPSRRRFRIGRTSADASVIDRTATQQLPLIVALLQLAIAAGYGPRTSISIVGEYGHGPVAGWFTHIAQNVSAGADLAQAVDLHREFPDGVRRVLRMLEQAERYGQPIGPQLGLLADELHREQIAEIDVASQRMSVHMIFPLVLCILPAFLLLSILPLLIALLDQINL